MSTGSDPSRAPFTITPSDTVNFSRLARGIYVGGDGDISLVAPNGDVVPFMNAKAGTTIPSNAIRINATGTTATYLVGLV